MEERPTPNGQQVRVRARFGDFITPWIEERQSEPYSWFGLAFALSLTISVAAVELLWALI
jgi:hypothetical protein